MKYVVLICSDETTDTQPGSPENQAVMEEYGALAADMAKAGVMVDGYRLRTTDTATTVRVDQGRVVTTDGPFAETKEQIGGFFVLECKDLDEATSWAARIPTARTGSVEVRPVWE
jgi:hypothetical protein